MEQTHALAHQAIFLDGQCLAARFAAAAKVLYAVADHGLDFVTFFGFELYQLAVVFILDLLFHDGDELGLLLAGVAFLVSSDAHEIRVDGAVPVFGYGDHQAAAA
nr:hypothetical protein [Mycobacteroides abscessus]